MSKTQSFRWLVVGLPIDPDAPVLPDPRPHPIARSALLVMAGGIVGSLGRAWVAVTFPHSATTWAWSTIIVNVVGSGALGLLLVLLIERFPTARTARPLFGTGLIGGFTTFSTFAVDAVQLAHAGRVGLAGLYVLVTLAGTFIATAVGIAIARLIDRLSDRERWIRRVRRAVNEAPEGSER